MVSEDTTYREGSLGLFFLYDGVIIQSKSLTIK